MPFPGIYRKVLKPGSQRDVCTAMFVTALFTIAKQWKQPKCASVGEWQTKCTLISIYMHDISI